ncbi:unnamed protein product, partial [Timema podura]|nr:unnamed protein product [Timema podura]
SVDCHEAIYMLLDHGADVNLMNDEGFTPLSLCMTRILAVLKDVKDWGRAFLQRKDYKKAETGAEWRQHNSYSQLNPNKSQSSGEAKS